MKTVKTETHIYCDFCGEECIHKPCLDEWGTITLDITGRDYNGNGARGYLIEKGDVCYDCLQKLRKLITKNDKTTDI